MLWASTSSGQLWSLVKASSARMKMLQVCLNYLKEKAAGLTGHIVHIQLQLNGPYLHRLSYICWLKRKTGMGNGHAAFKAPAGSVSLQL